MTEDFTRDTPRGRAAAESDVRAEPAAGAPSSNGARDIGGSGGNGGNGAARRQTPGRAVSAVSAVSADLANSQPEPDVGEASTARRGGSAARRADDAPEPRPPAPTGHGDAGGGDGLHVHLEFDFPSDVGYIERVVAVVIRQCEEFGFPPRQCALNVPVALTEALSNAILRGNGDDRTKQVRVRADVDQRALVMEVADEGQGFDFAKSMRDPTAPENLDREDGRGLYLMQRLMDRVERFNDGGNVVRLTLKRG